MNSRLFLYSAFFFVSILLYDSYQTHINLVTTNNQVEQIPDTSIDRKNKPSLNPSTTRTAQPNYNEDNSVTVTSDTLKIKISLKDGSIIKSELLNYRKDFAETSDNILLIDAVDQEYIARSDIQINGEDDIRNYQSQSNDYTITSFPYRVSLKGSSDKIEIEKNYLFTENSHLVSVETTVRNKQNSQINVRHYNTIQRGTDESQNMMLYTYTGAAYYDSENKFNKISFDDIAEENFKLTTNSSWIGMLQHYFFTAWISQDGTNQTIYTRDISTDSKDIFLIGSVSDYVSIDGGSESSFVANLYAGPKTVAEISEITEGLDLTVDYGVLTFLASPLFWVLEKLHYVFENWGFALIMLTILIKLLFFKLSETSYKSMAKMKKLSPRMTALKERYADDRKKFSEELMKVYKQEKVNPLGGCLPILVQIPVFIALYWVIVESVEMRHAPFVGWITDLSSKDPFYVLPVLMGVSMYLQQKLNPPPTDAMQQKIFMALPFIFTVLFATFPSGLVLYWLVNNILSIGQQYVINRRLAV